MDHAHCEHRISKYFEIVFVDDDVKTKTSNKMSVVDRDTAAGLAFLLHVRAKDIREILVDMGSFLPELPSNEETFSKGWRSGADRLLGRITTIAEILDNFKSEVSVGFSFNYGLSQESKGWRVEVGRYGGLLRAFAAEKVLLNVINDLKTTTAHLALDNATDDEIKSVVDSGVRDCMLAINAIGNGIFGEKSS